MGKRKIRGLEALFVTSTKSLTDRNETLNKIRKDLWLTTVKQQKLMQLLRNEISGRKNSTARNAVHDVSELLKKRINQAQDIVENTFRYFIQLHKKRRPEKQKSRPL